jgi:hypothetical protein
MWLGGRFTFGHGAFWLRRKNWKTHRVAWALVHGDPGSLCVCHHCDNPPCVNPAHLFIGTNSDNTADKVAKGRQATGDRLRPDLRARGARQHLAKLSEHAVLEIRELATRVATSEIAERFGVAPSSVRRVLRGETWAHVKTEAR